MRDKLYFVDTVVLSNFAMAGESALLVSRYRDRMRVTDEVIDELIAGVAAGHSSLGSVINIIEENADLSIRLTPEERKLFSKLIDHQGSGEASCVAVAINREGVVVTDDAAARDCCLQHNVLFTGTIGILKAMCVEDELSVTQADKILDNMIEAGFYSPVSRIRDVL